MSDLFDFLLDDEEFNPRLDEEHWNVLIIDDDPSVHQATKYVLSDFTFCGKTINWLDAYTAEEAKYIVHQNRDIALMFLDVVMETDNAGLNFVKWFRDSRINPSTRIVLRTGQPGQAPEPQIIVNYDLHDYKTKTELSSGKLYTTTVSALRAYRDMSRLESTRLGLENIINASVMLFQIQSLNDFAQNTLRQFKGILDLKSEGVIFSYCKKKNSFALLASTSPVYDPDFEMIKNLLSDKGTSDNILNKSPNLTGKGSAQSSAASFSANDPSKNTLLKILFETHDEQYILYFSEIESFTDIQNKMLEMMYANLSIGLSNIILYNELLKAHQSIVMSLAQITEGRDSDTGRHVFRIAQGTEILARETYKKGVYPGEIDEKTLSIIGLSSTLHDIGKISVPDAILLKPGKLTPDEFDHIKEHPEKGAEILQSVMDYNHSNLQYIELGKQIAMYHHERWNGTGYPHGLKETEIPIAARITTIIDVFDALINRRCYKNALPVEDCLRIIEEGKNTFFDPVISDIFIENFDKLYENVWKDSLS